MNIECGDRGGVMQFTTYAVISPVLSHKKQHIISFTYTLKENKDCTNTL